MIYFSAMPDPIFVDLVHTAIDETMDRYLSYDDPRDQEDWFCAGLPRSARFFPASEAKQHLRNLQQALRGDELYEASKYHWLLLYECLDIFCQEFNEQPAGTLVERYGLQRLDFQRLIQLYFRDTGFLDDNLATMAQQQRPMMIFPETLGLLAGFKRDPRELLLKVCDDQQTQAFGARQAPSRNAHSTHYP